MFVSQFRSFFDSWSLIIVVQGRVYNKIKTNAVNNILLLSHTVNNILLLTYLFLQKDHVFYWIYERFNAFDSSAEISP